MVELREVRGKEELVDRRAEVESWLRRLEAGTRNPLTTMELETGRPTASPHHRRWAEGE